MRVLLAREREARAWQLHCALAPAYAQTEDGQEHIQALWDALQPPAGVTLDPAAEAALVEQAQAQARLDGLVRTAPAQRGNGHAADSVSGVP